MQARTSRAGESVSNIGSAAPGAAVRALRRRALPLEQC